MRLSTAYFAGAGTVAAAIVAGLGGGLLFSNIVSPHAPRTEMSRLELRMSEKPVPASTAPSEPVPYRAATVSAPATEAQNQPESSKAAAQPTETQAAAPVTQPSTPDQAKTEQAKIEPAKTEQAKTEQAKVPEAAVAKPSDADMRRETRRAEDRRRAERRQQWTERRRQQPRQDVELREVEQKVREATEPRQVFATEPVRLETPRIRLFGDE
jgi:hypothetical protein